MPDMRPPTDPAAPGPAAPREPPAERFFSAAGWVYIILLPCCLRLYGPLFAHDLLAPVFAAALLWRREWGRWRRPPDLWLAAFGLWCVAVTLGRFLTPSGAGAADLYELAVFGYVGLLYAFFSRTRLAPRGLGRYAAGVAVGLWVLGAVQAACGGVKPHSAYVGSTLGFLARRYGAAFGNPSLLASFLILPLTCALLAAPPSPGGGPPAAPRRHGLRLAAVLAALGVPLLLTGSRHLILSLALVLGGLAERAPEAVRPQARRAAWALLAGAFAVIYLTVLIPFFPLQGAAPFVNARTPGMYLIHQDAYLRLAAADLPSLAFGIGRSAVRERYPAAVDPALTRRVLHAYGMQDLIPSFLAYMDAHNEYLNLTTAFGLPAVLLAGAFLAALARRIAQTSPGTPGSLAAFLTVALAMACLWDDLLSKRWVWVTLGILAAAPMPAAPPAAGPARAADRVTPP